MLQEVGLGQKSLADYRHIAGRGVIDRIHELAGPLRGKSILHVSATAFGGGVSEILYTLVPLMRDVGLDAHWQVILGREDFFNVTKLMHNSLQGDAQEISDQQWEVFEAYNVMNAQSLEGEWDVIIIHDPQPTALKRVAPDRGRRWVWRCHIDLSTPNPSTIERMLPLISEYDATVWHREEYVPAGLDGGIRKICPPAIDPLSPKNMALSPEDAAFVCEQFGIDTDRPLVCQVSRFDPWKDPIGVIDAYRIVRERVPDAQLALVGSMATDDPEGWEFFHQTFSHADGDPDIKILNNLNNVGAIEVNAFQSQADVCMQKSIREGFGLTVTEAQWKGRPMVGGDVGGIPLQIENGVSGFLVSTAEEAAGRTIEILEDPELAKQIGRAGKEHAREHFLTPRLLRDWLDLLSELQP
ncbi:MAG TPA: glycosyltransferase [Solirubrobacterales bacterium]|nr:glycosyltransferase [Solirubrobacterales bacterium]